MTCNRKESKENLVFHTTDQERNQKFGIMSGNRHSIATKANETWYFMIQNRNKIKGFDITSFNRKRNEGNLVHLTKV